MRTLLIVTAVLEAGTGLSLLLLPSLPVSLLFGASLDTPAALTIARLCGAALLSLGMVCWAARNEKPGHALTGLVVAMLFYNTAAVGLLVAHSGIGFKSSAGGLWPAVLLHTGLAIWCINGLRMARLQPGAIVGK
jgi:hypothetical protein